MKKFFNVFFNVLDVGVLLALAVSVVFFGFVENAPLASMVALLSAALLILMVLDKLSARSHKQLGDTLLSHAIRFKGLVDESCALARSAQAELKTERVKLREATASCKLFREQVLMQADELQKLREELGAYVMSDDEIARQLPQFGGFATSLFSTWQRADSRNRQILKVSFDELWRKAIERAMAERVKEVTND